MTTEVSLTDTAPSNQGRGDATGLLISGICLLHCLVAPAIAVLIPALSLGLFPGSHLLLHWVLLALAIPVSLWTFQQGLKVHRLRRPLQLGLAGLGLMVAGVLSESWIIQHAHASSEHLHGADSPLLWLTSLGVLLVTAAHLYNWRATVRLRSQTGSASCGPGCRHSHRHLGE